MIIRSVVKVIAEWLWLFETGFFLLSELQVNLLCSGKLEKGLEGGLKGKIFGKGRKLDLAW